MKGKKKGKRKNHGDMKVTGEAGASQRGFSEKVVLR